LKEGPRVSVFFIAEAGVNHNGDLARALDMVDAAAAAGADAIKFQTFTAEKLVSPTAQKADYQKRETGEGNQFDMLKALELSEDGHRQIFDRCAQRGIEFMSTPFDTDALDFLVDLGMARLKVPSGELVNHPFLRKIAAKDRAIILSTGMATMEEIHEAIAVIAKARAEHGYAAPLADVLTILHCTSNYPAACSDVNLRAMVTIASETGMSIGYSDHTLGMAVSIAAVGMGATVIEKHFTLDRALPGPDHRASLPVDEMTNLIAQIRDVEAALGSTVKAPSDVELPVRAVARRSVCAATDLVAGHVLTEADLALLRPASGIEPKHFEAVQGRVLARAVAAGTPLMWGDLA
jgi:N,N'-diacetyllegionaminate synthase